MFVLIIPKNVPILHNGFVFANNLLDMLIYKFVPRISKNVPTLQDGFLIIRYANEFVPIFPKNVPTLQGPYVCAKLVKQVAKSCRLDPWQVCLIIIPFPSIFPPIL